MQDKFGLDEYFYSMEWKEERKKYFNRLNQFSPLIDGAMYQNNQHNDEIVGLIPMKPDDDFQYLTYYVKEYSHLFNASILNCYNYPLCTMNQTYEKSLLLLRVNDKSYCDIFFNMYTKKNNVTLRPEVTLLKSIKKNSEENFIVSLSTFLNQNVIKEYDISKFKFFLNVKILSGEIEVELKGANLYKYANKYLYEKESGRTDFFNFKIKAKK